MFSETAVYIKDSQAIRAKTRALRCVRKEAVNSFQHFFNSYTLKDENYPYLISDATMKVLCNA